MEREITTSEAAYLWNVSRGRFNPQREFNDRYEWDLPFGVLIDYIKSGRAKQTIDVTDQAEYAMVLLAWRPS